MAEPKALESTLNKLSIHPETSKSASSFKSKQKVSESWEDEALDESPDDTDRPLSQQASADYPSAPPPTPISPSTSFGQASYVNPYGYSIEETTDKRIDRGNVRGEKTDAMVKRMIAGALGVRPPKRTEEQKAYDKAIKEKETRRKNMEREAAAKEMAEAEKQKAAMWDD